MQATINAKKINLSHEEARTLAVRALAFKPERGRLLAITAPDAWERHMAEGIAFLQRQTAANG